MTEYIVVGSGPAGVAAAKALLANKCRVLMLDAGKQLPAKQQALVLSLQEQHPGTWKPFPSSDALQKRRFGSAYMFETPELQITARDALASGSFARGGLSSVWGASVLPYEQDDMRAWPKLDLAPYYRKILGFVPLAGASDALARRFPLYAEPEELRSSSQLRALLAHCSKHETALRKSGFVVGRSRLAVKAFPVKAQNGCVYCGLCMTGCPYGLVYSAEQTLEELQQEENFTYEAGVVVSQLHENNGSPVIKATRLGHKTRYSGKKVFLATGVFSTAHTLLKSKDMDEVAIKDSQYIIIPCLMKKRGSPGRHHALAQAFIELRDEKLGNVHLQIYSFSDLIEQSVADKLGILYKLLRPFLRPLVQRLVVIQAFLHSDVSGSMKAHRTDSGLEIEGSHCVQKKRLPRVLLRHAGKLGLLPLLPLVEYALPGQGFHSGGSFPMSDEPGEGDSDVLGRFGFENIHVVDSSILPGIAGTTITLTEMANAYRIADMASRGET
jgi:choline dehydrogenase-like flavoprotein